MKHWEPIIDEDGWYLTASRSIDPEVPEVIALPYVDDPALCRVEVDSVFHGHVPLADLDEFAEGLTRPDGSPQFPGLAR
jgi:hypothetical protein